MMMEGSVAGSVLVTNVINVIKCGFGRTKNIGILDPTDAD
jgi:hypothetical protein